MDAQHYRANRPDVIDEQFDDEYVLVNLRTGTYYGLSHTAAEMWDLLNQSLSRAQILERMQLLYDANPARIAADFDDMLTELLQEQLVVPETGGSNPASDLPGAAPSVRREYLVPHIEKYTDMQALLLLDPIHQVDASGWPATRADAR